MIKFNPTTLDDQPEILRWSLADPYHSSNAVIDGPGWWLTGADCLQAFCAEDDAGPVMYVRLDQEDNLIRMHIQYAPESEVDKSRVIETMKIGLLTISIWAKELGNKGLIFESTSPSLIKFCLKLGFMPADRDNVNDYVLVF